ncbi:MAG: hypothetical protein WC807_19185 [Hyphomicrobium sp.]|jgi:hypothetical protein
MDSLSDLQASLSAIAERSSAIKSSCTNEQSTKQFLVLPVIGALGYDCGDPTVVQPEFVADFRVETPERVDYVILRDGSPVIAVECKKAGSDLSLHRGQLRTYFSALRSVRVGLLTDGLRFEFYVDCESPNIMDEEPFLTLDLDAASRTPIPIEVVQTLNVLSNGNFHPDAISDAAEMRLVARRLRAVLVQELREPSEEFCRHVLQRVGIKNLRRSSIQSRYGSLIRGAFEEALVIPVLDRLRSLAPTSQAADDDGAAVQRIVTTDRELAIYRYACRRLAFLAEDEHQFTAIERVQHRDYVGKFAVFYENVRKGRLFDFVEGGNGYDKFIFPEPFGEIVASSVIDIDEPLRKIFAQRVRELGVSKVQESSSRLRA